MRMNPAVDLYLSDGCGRCKYYQTPQCKVHHWQPELQLLRKMALSCGLQEDYKWSQPCYTLNGKNVFIVTAFKHYACVAFFKGALLKDPECMLVQPGERSESTRQLRFTSTEQINQKGNAILELMLQAIEIEQSGQKVEIEQKAEPIPAELKQAFKIDPELKAAFEQLSPGRQRGYLIHFNQAKKSESRCSRIEKQRSNILSGKGMNGR